MVIFPSSEQIIPSLSYIFLLVRGIANSGGRGIAVIHIWAMVSAFSSSLSSQLQDCYPFCQSAKECLLMHEGHFLKLNLDHWHFPNLSALANLKTLTNTKFNDLFPHYAQRGKNPTPNQPNWRSLCAWARTILPSVHLTVKVHSVH